MPWTVMHPPWPKPAMAPVGSSRHREVVSFFRRQAVMPWEKTPVNAKHCTMAKPWGLSPVAFARAAGARLDNASC
jgi:hypothetical protein